MWTKNCDKYTIGWLDGGGGSPSLPQLGSITFSADFTSNTTPSVGTDGTFARAAAEYMGTGASTLTTVGSGVAAVPAFAFGGAGTGGGVQILGARKNLITFSDDLTNAAWTTVGTLSTLVYAATGSPDPAVANSTTLIASSNNSGRDIDSGVVAASKSFVGSMYVKSTNAGNQVISLTLEGTAASESVSSGFTATPVWQRFSLSKTFTAGAAGNCHLKILMANFASVLVVGAQLEQIDDATNGSQLLNPSALLRTSGATATGVADSLQYPQSGNINTTAGTLSIWVNPLYADTQLNTGVRYFFDINTTDLAIYHLKSGNTVYAEYKNSASAGWAATFSAFVWQHFVYTWNLTGGNVTVFLYRNGVQVATWGPTAATAPASNPFFLGAKSDLTIAQSGEVILGRIRIWSTVLNSTEAANVYNFERGFYGI